MINDELLKWLLCDNRNPVEEKQLLASSFIYLFILTRLYSKSGKLIKKVKHIGLHFMTWQM